MYAHCMHANKLFFEVGSHVPDDWNDPHALEHECPDPEFSRLLLSGVHDEMAKDEPNKDPLLHPLQVDRLQAQGVPEARRHLAHVDAVRIY